MKELLATIRQLISENIDGVKQIESVPELENMIVLEMENGKKYAVSLLELD